MTIASLLRTPSPILIPCIHLLQGLCLPFRFGVGLGHPRFCLALVLTMQVGGLNVCKKQGIRRFDEG